MHVCSSRAEGGLRCREEAEQALLNAIRALRSPGDDSESRKSVQAFAIYELALNTASGHGLDSFGWERAFGPGYSRTVRDWVEQCAAEIAHDLHLIKEDFVALGTAIDAHERIRLQDRVEQAHQALLTRCGVLINATEPTAAFSTRYFTRLKAIARSSDRPRTWTRHVDGLIAASAGIQGYAQYRRDLENR